MDESGEAYVSFNIPSYTKQDVMTLVVTVRNQAEAESSTHVVSLSQVSKLTVKFTPETTDLLVKNMPNWVYFETWADEYGSDVASFESAQLVIQDSDNETIIGDTIKPEKLGRGRFLFTPEGSNVYMLKVRVNKASKDTYHLIPRVDESLSLNFMVSKGSVECLEPIELEVYGSSQSNGTYTLQLNLKDKNLFNTTFSVDERIKHLSLLPPMTNETRVGGIF
jgi:hypothetical protein